MTPHTSSQNHRIPRSYYELVRRFPLVLITSDRHLHQAQEVIDDLLKKDRLDSGEEAYLEVLGNMVMAYEDEHHPIPAASDADLLRHLMEAQEISQADVSRQAGIARSTLSQILSGRRAISMSHVVPLARVFHVEAGVFIRGEC